MVTEQFLAELFDETQPIVPSTLQQLAGLSDVEAITFRHEWLAAPERRRAQVLEQIALVAEDNAEFDFDAIFRIGLDDEAPEIRVQAVEGLWECQDRWLLNRLMQLAETDVAEPARAAAASGLGKFVLLGVLEELRPSLVEQVEGALKRIIDDLEEAPGVRRRAIESLGASADGEVNGIIRSAYHEEEPELKLAAIYAMGQHCDPAWLPALLRELRNPDAAFRFEAARACGELEDERAVPALIELAGEDDAIVQEAALEALGRIGGDDAKLALKRAAAQDDPRVSEAARAALEELAFDENPRPF